MSDPDAFTTLPMAGPPSDAAALASDEFVLLALRAGESSFEGWERLRLRLAEQE